MQFTLKELRARKDESQQETAKGLGVSTPTYCAWEKSILNIPIKNLFVLSDYFNVAIEEIKLK